MTNKEDEKIDISIVTPVYGKNLDLPQLYNRLVAVSKKMGLSYEIIMVDDRNPHPSWQVIRGLSKLDSRVRGIRLSRNFGQHAAITAGLELARGNWCVVLDCDLQDRPEEIERFYTKATEGYDVVVGRRKKRTDSLFARITSYFFYVIFNYLTGQKLDNDVANFGIYSSKVIKAVRRYIEVERSFGLLVIAAGFERAEIDITHGERLVGRSAYTFWRRLDLAINLILAHSNKPLRLTIFGGFSVTAISFMYGLWLIFNYLSSGQTVAGWTSLIVSQCFFSGLIIAVLGIVGLYVGKTYDQVKGRPLFLVDEIVGVE